MFFRGCAIVEIRTHEALLGQRYFFIVLIILEGNCSLFCANCVVRTLFL